MIASGYTYPSAAAALAAERARLEARLQVSRIREGRREELRTAIRNFLAAGVPEPESGDLPAAGQPQKNGPEQAEPAPSRRRRRKKRPEPAAAAKLPERPGGTGLRNTRLRPGRRRWRSVLVRHAEQRRGEGGGR